MAATKTDQTIDIIKGQIVCMPARLRPAGLTALFYVNVETKRLRPSLQ